MSRKKILIIGGDLKSNITLETSLKLEGYDVFFAHDQEMGIEKARWEKPDLILLDTGLLDTEGLDIVRNLKENPVTKFIPVIALSDLVDTLTGVRINADAYLLKPFSADELKSEIDKLLLRTVEHLSANPLTKLPGSVSIEQNIISRINKNEKFAVCYIDIDNFKPFNDYYGFHRGDQVIQFLAQTIIDSCKEKGTENDFIGHIGGDDFVLVTIPEKSDDICNKIIEVFDKNILNLYDDTDIQKGYITTRDRRFQLHNFPIMTISISVATNEKRILDHYGKIVNILFELKKYAKTMKERKGSIFVKDRRSDTTSIPTII
jgi:diguanylate cyclase (GGDEF)-like protein